MIYEEIGCDMNILIIGGTGFIGSHLVTKLLNLGHSLELLTRFPERYTISSEFNNLTLTKGCITDLELHKDLVKGKDICIYLAFNYSEGNASSMLVSDALPAIQIADSCVSAGVKHFIYTSSTAVNDYVYKSDTAKIEGHIHNVDEKTKHNPISYYGATKSATEIFLNALSFITKMKVNIIRPGYTFGRHLFSSSTVHSDNPFLSILNDAMEGKDINIIKNDGVQFIAAEDLIKIYVNTITDSTSSKMYLGLSNQCITWEVVASKIIELCKSKSKIKIEDRGWKEPILFDVSAIKKDFGLEFNPWNKLVEHFCFLEKKIKNISVP